MGRNNLFFKIPVEMLVWSIQHKRTRELQIYFALKERQISCRHMKRLYYDRATKTWITKKLSISQRTLERTIKNLSELNWIGYNQIKKVIHCRGIDLVRKNYKWQSRRAISVDIKHFSSIPKVKAVCLTAIVSKLIRAQHANKIKRLGLRRGERIRKEYYPSIREFYPVALRAIEKCFGISKESVRRHKAKAVKMRILIIKQPEDRICKEVTIEGLPFYEGDKKNKLFIRQGKVYERPTCLMKIKSSDDFRYTKRMKLFKASL